MSASLSLSKIFTVAPVADDLNRVAVARVSTSGSMTLGLLPATAKNGMPSLKSVSGLKGQALKAFKRRMQDDMKTAMAKEFAGRCSQSGWTGRKVTISKSGVMGFFIEQAGEAPVVKDATSVAEGLPTEQLLAILEKRGEIKVNRPAAPAPAAQ